MISAGTITTLGGTSTVTPKYASFNYITAAGTTTLKSGAGVFHCLSGTYAGSGTLYNSAGTSAAIIWSGAIATPTTLTFDVGFGSATWAGTGSSALTVVYS
jgi:hypothetical protein